MDVNTVGAYAHKVFGYLNQNWPIQPPPVTMPAAFPEMLGFVSASRCSLTFNEQCAIWRAWSAVLSFAYGAQQCWPEPEYLGGKTADLIVEKHGKAQILELKIAAIRNGSSRGILQIRSTCQALRMGGYRGEVEGFLLVINLSNIFIKGPNWWQVEPEPFTTNPPSQWAGPPFMQPA
jgi:hypothetical protein